MNTFMFKYYCDNEYLLQKIKAYSKIGEENNEATENILEYMASLVTTVDCDLPLADEKEERSKLSPMYLAAIDRWVKLGLRIINRDFPLVNDESIISDRFSFLNDEFTTFPKGTPVLIRETNKATMIHFFPCSVYCDGLIQESSNFISEPSTTVQQRKSSTENYKVGDSILLSLFTGMASGIGEKIGAELFNKIFPDNSSNIQKMLSDLQENIKNIFRQELDSDTIDKLNLRIQGVIKYMQQTYTSLKKSGKPTSELENLLNSQNQIMYTDIMALLVGERYRSKGIAYLVVGANAHLAILQELLNITGNTGYKDNYTLKLRDYIETLGNAISEVYNNRLTYLTPCQESTLKGVSDDHWWFVDNWAHYTSESYYNSYSWDDKRRGGDGYTIDAYKKANAARNDYSNRAFLPRIVDDLKIYVDMKNSWQDTLAKALNN